MHLNTTQAISITCSHMRSMCPSPPLNITVLRVVHTCEAHIQLLLRIQAAQGHCTFMVYYNPSSQKNGYTRKKNFNISNTAFCLARGELSTKAIWFNYCNPCCLRARAQTDADSSMWISPSWAGAIFLGCRESGSVCSHPNDTAQFTSQTFPIFSFFFWLEYT